MAFVFGNEHPTRDMDASASRTKPSLPSCLPWKVRSGPSSALADSGCLPRPPVGVGCEGSIGRHPNGFGAPSRLGEETGDDLRGRPFRDQGVGEMSGQAHPEYGTGIFGSATRAETRCVFGESPLGDEAFRYFEDGPLFDSQCPGEHTGRQREPCHHGGPRQLPLDALCQDRASYPRQNLIFAAPSRLSRQIDTLSDVDVPNPFARLAETRFASTVASPVVSLPKTVAEAGSAPPPRGLAFRGR